MEREIQLQVNNVDPSEVEELVLDNWNGEQLSLEHKQLLERYNNLDFLSLSGCGLRSLKNFPELPNLIKLDLTHNDLSGELQSISHLPELMQVCLNSNRIATLQELEPLKPLENLISLDLDQNPVCELPEFRKKVFKILPQLKLLDDLNSEGEEGPLFSEEEEDQDEEDLGFLDELGQIGSDYEVEVEETTNSKRPRQYNSEATPQKRTKQ